METLKNTKAIGFFDSGLGGLSVWKEVNKLLPYEPTIYLADSTNAPYGVRSRTEITELSIKNTEYLLEQGCKLIVVACNTATTSAIDHLRSQYDVPFVGIEPAIKTAALRSQSKRVGVLATKGTLISDLFLKTKDTYAKDVHTIAQQGTGLVELIEAGKLNSAEVRQLLASYIDPMVEEGIDYLVLGCTHYPFLMDHLAQLLPAGVEVIDSGSAIARRVQQILESKNLLTENSTKDEVLHQFCTNRSEVIMQEFMQLVEISGQADFCLF